MSHFCLSPGDEIHSRNTSFSGKDRALFHCTLSRGNRSGRSHGLTLVEVMFALVIQATVMLALIGSFIHSRRITEASVLHAAASSLVYGMIEQIKGLEYTKMLPAGVDDTADPTNSDITNDTVRVRINQDRTVRLNVVYTPAKDSVTGVFNTPRGPLTTPTREALAAAVGGGAIDNFIGALPLSTVTGTASQSLALNIWIWIDELAPTGDVSEVKKITFVYTYSYMDGMRERIVRDREVFLRTRFDQ